MATKYGFHPKSDMKLMHMLASRGLSFDSCWELLQAERKLTKTNENLTFIMKQFMTLSNIAKCRIVSPRTDKGKYVKHMFCYYCSEHTEMSTKEIADFVKSSRDLVYYYIKTIKDDVDVNYEPTTKFLNRVEKRILKMKLKDK